MCYYFADYGWLISGDTLFQMSIGRTDFPTGNLNDLLTAIREKIIRTPTMDKGTIRSYTTNDDRGGKQMQSVSAIDYDWINSEQDHL